MVLEYVILLLRPFSFREKPFVNVVLFGVTERQKSGGSVDSKRISWNLEDVAVQLDTFRPVTLTVSSFFKQVTFLLFEGPLFWMHDMSYCENKTDDSLLIHYWQRYLY